MNNHNLFHDITHYLVAVLGEHSIQFLIRQGSVPLINLSLPSVRLHLLRCHGHKLTCIVVNNVVTKTIWRAMNQWTDVDPVITNSFQLQFRHGPSKFRSCIAVSILRYLLCVKTQRLSLSRNASKMFFWSLIKFSTTKALLRSTKTLTTEKITTSFQENQYAQPAR